MADWQKISGGITAPKGYRAAGIRAGLKPSGLPDLALIVSDVPAIAAGVFTTSHVCAAPVQYCRERLQAKANAQAILCNAGQANAATGAQGWTTVLDQAQLVGDALNLPPESVFVASTGVIGKPIPLDKIRTALPTLIDQLTDSGSDAAAQAIMTTDLVPKAIALEADFDGHPIRIGGIAKGSGMIHPNMATMLAFVTCDAAVSPHLWQEMVSRASDRSFNQITVDGDTSTNDTLLALANGQSRTPAIIDPGPIAERLEAMLTDVCMYLAKSIARDGEGATCLLEIQVQGANDDASAREIARTVAGSMLFKSAVFGRDPNWGRIAAAVGRAGVYFDQNNLSIQLGDILMMEQGQPLNFDRAAANAYLVQQAQRANQSESGQSVSHPVVIQISIGQGGGQGIAWGCDLSYEYVKINAEYTT
ncbi:bifunctional glutamate N-acetyltransferase/amino-acid acetyltransferase ArgJ [Candidatus Synechococcus calcipolaris G9]|uniref:Arginine biosynthesis bifunctional protein ArgJ n=1 Tax=Candidatus Synechococcus calcipolaris G9 TaxID=1497997 RepID=A0ABT6EXN8_9SYNE|nr:bifunctional glutamate N-acetyltransferase/amino-acid acetyltransferase ArgJ [Candidatus Synechococcus calcipolaris]MDG2990006.1 bifunctional glutamate N-acetyltransferase/amino-acid acetyltransferase ArgJ [Candidatus Synechococcus calcipolaris G9]